MYLVSSLLYILCVISNCFNGLKLPVIHQVIKSEHSDALASTFTLLFALYSLDELNEL